MMVLVYIFFFFGLFDERLGTVCLVGISIFDAVWLVLFLGFESHLL
jgi:hypothetical protein